MKDTHEGPSVEMAAAADTACGSEGAEVTASNEAAATEVTIPAESSVGTTAEVCVVCT